MDFAQSFHFQNILQNEALFDIMKQNLPSKAARASLKIMQDTTRELSALDTITLGPNSDYSHLTDYLDDLFDSIITLDTNPEGATPETVRNRVNAYRRSATLLREANQKGIWSPKRDLNLSSVSMAGGKENNIDSQYVFKQDSNSTSSAFQVKGKDFAAWYNEYFLKPAEAAGKSFLSDIGTGSFNRENLIRETMKVPEEKVAFFRNGPDGPATQ
jgi:hypothetical protein